MDAVHKRCDIQNPAFWQTLHILSVTETNGLGSETTTLHLRLYKLRKILLIHRDIRLLGHFVEASKQTFPGVSVKPDPPESVSVRQIEGFSTRLMVSWNFPSSWPRGHAFPLIFNIRYRPLGSMFWSEVSKAGLFRC